MKTILALTLSLSLASQAFGCPFCNGNSGQSLAGEYNAASLIVVGTLKNWQRNLQDPDKSSTELHVTSVIKDHPYLSGKKMVLLPRYFPPPDPANPDAPVLVFASIYPKAQDTAVAALVGGLVLGDFNRQIFDPYRGDVMTGKGELAVYMKGAMDLREKPMVERLAFYFKYLDAQDLTICSDAFLEFAQADYKDVRAFTEKASMDQIAKWLQDPNTPPSHFGLLGMMLGHSKREQDAVLLKKLLDEEKKFYSGGIDGILGGYILQKPREGWDYLLKMMLDPKAKFETRYAALNTIRFLWEYRPDVVKKEDLLKALRKLMDIDDICDMPIENLRKWKNTDLTAEIVKLARDRDMTKNTFLRRAIVKYIMTESANNKDAAALLNDLRKTRPEWINAAKESLEQEHLAEEAKKDVKP